MLRFTPEIRAALVFALRGADDDSYASITESGVLDVHGFRVWEGGELSGRVEPHDGDAPAWLVKVRSTGLVRRVKDQLCLGIEATPDGVAYVMKSGLRVHADSIEAVVRGAGQYTSHGIEDQLVIGVPSLSAVDVSQLRLAVQCASGDHLPASDYVFAQSFGDGVVRVMSTDRRVIWSSAVSLPTARFTGVAHIPAGMLGFALSKGAVVSAGATSVTVRYGGARVESLVDAAELDVQGLKSAMERFVARDTSLLFECSASSLHKALSQLGAQDGDPIAVSSAGEVYTSSMVRSVGDAAATGSACASTFSRARTLSQAARAFAMSGENRVCVSTDGVVVKALFPSGATEPAVMVLSAQTDPKNLVVRPGAVEVPGEGAVELDASRRRAVKALLQGAARGDSVVVSRRGVALGGVVLTWGEGAAEGGEAVRIDTKEAGGLATADHYVVDGDGDSLGVRFWRSGRVDSVPAARCAWPAAGHIEGLFSVVRSEDGGNDRALRHAVAAASVTRDEVFEVVYFAMNVMPSLPELGGASSVVVGANTSGAHVGAVGVYAAGPSFGVPLRAARVMATGEWSVSSDGDGVEVSLPVARATLRCQAAQSTWRPQRVVELVSKCGKGGAGFAFVADRRGLENVLSRSPECLAIGPDGSAWDVGGASPCEQVFGATPLSGEGDAGAVAVSVGLVRSMVSQMRGQVSVRAHSGSLEMIAHEGGLVSYAKTVWADDLYGPRPDPWADALREPEVSRSI